MDEQDFARSFLDIWLRPTLGSRLPPIAGEVVKLLCVFCKKFVNKARAQDVNPDAPGVVENLNAERLTDTPKDFTAFPAPEAAPKRRGWP